MIYIKRVLVIPFIFGVLFVSAMLLVFRKCMLFIQNGGELIGYEQGQQVKMQDLYKLIKENERSIREFNHIQTSKEAKLN